MAAILVLLPENNRVIAVEAPSRVAVYEYALNDSYKVRTLLNVKAMGEELDFEDIERFFSGIGYEPKYLSDIETIEVLVTAVLRVAEEL